MHVPVCVARQLTTDEATGNDWGAIVDFGICFELSGLDRAHRREPPGYRLYLTPTPATLTKLTIIRERTRMTGTRLYAKRKYRWRIPLFPSHSQGRKILDSKPTV